MANQNHKQVKLQPKHRALSYGQKIVPELKISGVWLQQLGFKAGDSVSITTRDRLLIIEPIEIEEESQSQPNYEAALQEVKQALKKIR